MTVFIRVGRAGTSPRRRDLRFDPYPFIFLTLMLSLQASYAAPLILLAQNRQDDRDRVNLEQDRAQNERCIADTEYLTREVADAADRARRGRHPGLDPLRAPGPVEELTKDAGERPADRGCGTPAGEVTKPPLTAFPRRALGADRIHRHMPPDATTRCPQRSRR